MPRNKQPFYHRMEVLFTATSDNGEAMNSPEFKRKLADFLAQNLDGVVKSSVGFDDDPDAEPGDPSDLM